MGIVLGSNFDVQTILPLDSRDVAADITARNAIVSGRRYQGLSVYVVADSKTYQLQGGILNANWVEVGSGGSGGLPIAGTTNQALTKIDATDYNTQWSTVDKTFVGLANVDNTSDANKPISTATQTALDLKASLINLLDHEADTTNIHGIADTAQLVTIAGAQTLTNKTLTSPTIDVATLDGQASTPTNPSAGFFKAYVKDSSGMLTILNSAGVETEVGSAAGGGAVGANWQPVLGFGVAESYEYSEKVLLFTNDSNRVMLWIRVPTSYKLGNPITVRLSFYSSASANNWAFFITSSLVRVNTDSIISTLNQGSVTSADITNTVALRLRQISFVIAPIGEINATAISPGDIIRMQLTRTPAAVGPQDTQDVRLIPSSTEVSFS